jgi:hypothetical protein
VTTPCALCAHTGLCAIEEQIEQNLVLEVVQIAVPASLTLSCDQFVAAPSARSGWTDDRRARFTATIAARRARNGEGAEP